MRPDPAAIERNRRRIECEREGHGEELVRMRRVLIHAFPAVQPAAVVLVDVAERKLTTLIGQQIAQAADHAADYEIIGAVGVRALLRALNVEPGERRLAELGPPQSAPAAAVDPWRRQHFVEKSPAKANCAVKATVLIERKERLGIGFEPAAKLHHVAVPQILAQGPLITERTADAARALNEQRGRDRERPSAPIELHQTLISSLLHKYASGCQRLERHRPSRDEWETNPGRWLREAVFRLDGVDGLERIARKTKRPQACLAWCEALADRGDWAGALRAYDASAALAGKSHRRANFSMARRWPPSNWDGLMRPSVWKQRGVPLPR